ncbi:MAG: AAA family ATPase [Candidatus Omnitrophica bacterium]|nr:AAA family ATPase [Candidatus Omnitrophota bacterium]
MYFKKLELVGFKSFCDKTTLHFEPGITAIVGPNGCGKSNIFDAIRWVLGEQSAKSLRGSEMQDVIFNGSDTREPLGMAEVSLTFDNKQRFFNFEHDEVMITRRLFRSGESEYLLNKTQVRLKDILDILLGTGIGAESYSIVAQGKIDLVLSSRPEDRRLVFDEASGITKYKAQKREAMRKLEETEQNLLRVNDIVTEVKRQIASLERQANKARKYKEVFEELKAKETSLACLERQEIFTQKQTVMDELSGLQSRESELIKFLAEEEIGIADRKKEVKAQEEAILNIKNEIIHCENQLIRNNERIAFARERLQELASEKKSLESRFIQLQEKLISDERKLSQLKQEFDGLKSNIEAKSVLLSQKDAQISELAVSIKESLEKIASAKKNVLELVSHIANAKNEITDFTTKKQIYIARKKRLEIEKAKTYEERVIVEESLQKATAEAESLRKVADELTVKIEEKNRQLEEEKSALNTLINDITGLEKEKLTLGSQKEFLDNLKMRYENIGESLNVVIHLDKMPQENVSGLVVKIKNLERENLRLSGEAKPIELDTHRIEEKISVLTETISSLIQKRQFCQGNIETYGNDIVLLRQELRQQEIALANKESNRSAVLEQFNKIKEEEDIIVMELSDVEREISVLENNIISSQMKLQELNKSQASLEGCILEEEEKVSVDSKAREELLVAITKLKTELETLNRRIDSDATTLKLLEDTYKQDMESLDNTKGKIVDIESKAITLEEEIKASEKTNAEIAVTIKDRNAALEEAQLTFKKATETINTVVAKIDSSRQEIDKIKNRIYELQMSVKDLDYRYSAIKNRMLEAYKIDLEGFGDSPQGGQKTIISQEIDNLKEKLDSYGAVNLVAIEEYDELKKRYDFLIQQQNDLVAAKDSLHEAILKINRTTKQMFMETFDKVKVEFRNYFRLLFNGGDAQVFLIDEQDPLESGIEIICRPPGKKLQNVLLLSGGEKSLAAIALIFAIFKVKPSPFCVLDEIDAALDEANVDRFSRVLQEFAKISQFIVITHNKKTIANADVMYGITMQHSGISRIVSVKFGKNPEKPKEEIGTAVTA